MKKKVIIITIAIVVAMIMVAGGCMYCMFHQQYAAGQSVEQVGDKMYTMTYEGDYGLDEFLKQGGASSANEIAAFVCRHLFYGLVSPDPAPTEFGCSFITSKDKDGNVLTGCNFDWPDCKSPIVVVHTRPDKGYASVSTSCISFLGFGDDWSPKDVADRMPLIAAIYGWCSTAIPSPPPITNTATSASHTRQTSNKTETGRTDETARAIYLESLIQEGGICRNCQ